MSNFPVQQLNSYFPYTGLTMCKGETIESLAISPVSEPENKSLMTGSFFFLTTTIMPQNVRSLCHNQTLVFSALG